MAKISLTLLLLVAFAVLSCQSPSPSPDRQPAASEVEFNVETIYSPRRFTELEAQILLNPGVQDCLRDAVSQGATDLAIGIEGRISYTGDTEDVQAETSPASLKTCLETHVSALKHGRGIQGPFKMQIHRLRQPASTGKGLILDMKTLKKIE